MRQFTQPFARDAAIVERLLPFKANEKRSLEVRGGRFTEETVRVLEHVAAPDFEFPFGRFGCPDATRAERGEFARKTPAKLKKKI